MLNTWGSSDNSIDSFQFLEIVGINRENQAVVHFAVDEACDPKPYHQPGKINLPKKILRDLPTLFPFIKQS